MFLCSFLSAGSGTILPGSPGGTSPMTGEDGRVCGSPDIVALTPTLYPSPQGGGCRLRRPRQPLFRNRLEIEQLQQAGRVGVGDDRRELRVLGIGPAGEA